MTVIVIVEYEPRPETSTGGIIGAFSSLTKAYEYVYSSKMNMSLSKVAYSTIATYLNPKNQGYFELDKKIWINKYTLNELVA